MSKVNLSIATDEEMENFMHETLRRLNQIAEAEDRSFVTVTFKSGRSVMIDMETEIPMSELRDMNDA